MLTREALLSCNLNQSEQFDPHLKKKKWCYTFLQNKHLHFNLLNRTRKAEVVLQKAFWLACLVYICNTVDSYSQPQIFTLHERSIATAIGKTVRLQALFFTSLYESISTVCMPGKVNPPEPCACTYEHVHVHLYPYRCVCVCADRDKINLINSVGYFQQAHCF